jgi:hypothetical protein
VRGLAAAHLYGQLQRRDQLQVQAEWPQLVAGAQRLLDLRPPAGVLRPGRLGPGVQERLAVRVGLLAALARRRERGLVLGVGLGQLVAQWRPCLPGQDLLAGQRLRNDALVCPGERLGKIRGERPVRGGRAARRRAPTMARLRLRWSATPVRASTQTSSRSWKCSPARAV